MRTPCLLLSLLVWLVACGTDSVSESGPDLVADSQADSAADLEPESASEPDLPRLPPAEPVVFAVISDTHLWASLEHSSALHLHEALHLADDLSPAAEFVAITGDFVDALTGPGPDGERPLALFKQVIDGSPVPVHLVPGNHDYYDTQMPDFALVEEQAVAEAEFAETLDLNEPYYVVDHQGFKFIFVNSMRGELWDLSMGLSGSVGQEQLVWLDEQLSDGAPAVLFLHHPPGLCEEDGAVSLADVVTAHTENVLGIFAGHLHLWSRDEFAGVPLYLTAANQDGVAYHHVRVDPESMTLTILNEDDIEYGEIELTECDPAVETPVADLSLFDETVHHLVVGEALAEPTGFGEYLEEAVKMLPLLIRFGPPDASGKAFPLHFSLGTYYGNAVGELPAYIESTPGAPCIETAMLLDNPCAVSQPFSTEISVGDAFGLTLPADWVLRAQLTNVEFQGVLTEAPEPHIEAGHLKLGLDLNVTIEDLQAIVVDDYCDHAIAACKPGSEGMPECPDGPSHHFFAEIPTQCDVMMYGFGIRMILGLLSTLPDGRGSVAATFTTRLPDPSASPAAGDYDPDLFSMKAGGNCSH